MRREEKENGHESNSEETNVVCAAMCKFEGKDTYAKYAMLI
jgi:hypothetical protein